MSRCLFVVTRRSMSRLYPGLLNSLRKNRNSFIGIYFQEEKRAKERKKLPRFNA